MDNMNDTEKLKIENLTKTQKSEIKSRFQYIKKIKGNIQNLSKNTKYDDLIFNFLKNKNNLEKIGRAHV